MVGGFFNSKRFKEGLDKVKSVASENMEAAAKEAVSKATEAFNYLADTIESQHNSFNEWVDDRTSIVGADSLERLKKSGNPLITLEKRQVPRNITSSLVYFAAASGVFSSSDEITRFTRAVMDDDSAVIQQMLRKVFDPEEAREISAWMDHAPGYSVAGGWAHRLHHGHDLDAMMTLYSEHGVTGVAEWMNHVWLRDFWTPHGVPYLPAGSGTIYDWLVGAGVKPATAMGLLSINAAEAASGILLISSGKKMVAGISRFFANRSYSKEIERIKELVDDGLHSQAIDAVDTLILDIDHEVSQHLKLDVALFCLGLSLDNSVGNTQLWGARAYRIADMLCQPNKENPESTEYLGDTEVSFAGLAGTVACTAFSSFITEEKGDLSWIVKKAQYSVREYLALAKKQIDGWSVSGVKVAGYRPYSAMTNQLLALELSISLGSLTSLPASMDPRAIRKQLMDSFEKAEMNDSKSVDFIQSIKSALERVYP